MDKFKRFIPPFLWVIGFQAVSSSIGMLTSSNIDGWYKGLEKSALTPPDIVFPIVWTALYVMVALAGWLIFRNSDGGRGHSAKIFYALYVFLNWGWSFVFFEFHFICAGFFWILAVNVANIGVIYKSWTFSRAAAFLMLPPLIWTSFAAYLNYAIWVLNP